MENNEISTQENDLNEKLIDICSENASETNGIALNPDVTPLRSSCLSTSTPGNVNKVQDCLKNSSHFDTFRSSVHQRNFNSMDDEPLIIAVDDDSMRESLIDTDSRDTDHCHTVKPSKRKSWQAIIRLLIASCLTIVFMIGEGVGGYLANSISIMSDAAHLLSDLTSFIVSLVAIYLAMRPASKKMSYGYQRAEVLGAVISVLLIWLITGVLVYVAIQRMITMDFEIEADTMIIVSAVGVFINIILGIVLHTGSIGGHGHSHGASASSDHNLDGGNANSRSNINIRAAFIHVLGDLIQSIGVFISAYIIRFYPDCKIADPICTFLFSIIVMFTTIPILRDLSIVLMEGTPPGVDISAICSQLSCVQGVKMVHSLHVWALTLEKKACSVHLAIGPDSDSELVLRDAQRIIRSKYHIYQTTIQVEQYDAELMDNCQQCQPLS